MPVTSFYADAEYDEQLQANPLQLDVVEGDSEQATDDTQEDDTDILDGETPKLPYAANRHTTDLVRL
jgi:RNA polymerase nonessential primary-like sigma factor